MRSVSFSITQFLLNLLRRFLWGTGKGNLGNRQIYMNSCSYQKKIQRNLNSFYLKIKSFSSRLYKLNIHDEMNNSNEISTTNLGMLLICRGNNHVDLFVMSKNLSEICIIHFILFDNYSCNFPTCIHPLLHWCALISHTVLTLNIYVFPISAIPIVLHWNTDSVLTAYDKILLCICAIIKNISGFCPHSWHRASRNFWDFLSDRNVFFIISFFQPYLS